MANVEARPQKTRIETYIPLYRKYRPQTFADVVGQEAIVQTLGNAIQLNRVAHAYLFCGPRGTGKTSTARIFAKSLNCEQGPTVTPCLQCASCMGIALGNALDVIEFDAASNNGVGDARELIENCQYSSMNGRFKVYIVDEVHMLTPQAFNTLLKTLEEPPANVIFIFATTEAHKVLPTIVSRCQRFDFNRITTNDIAVRLHSIAQTEAIQIDEEAVRLIARHSRGGLRDAVGLLDQVSVLGRGKTDHVVHRQDVALFIGALEEELLLRLSGAIAERRAADLLNTLSELVNRGLEPLQLLKDLTQHFRNLLLLQAMGPNAKAEDLDLAAETVNALKAQIVLFSHVEELPQILARLAAVERNVRHSAQPQLWLEVGLLELAYRHEIALVQDLSERVQALEAALSSPSAGTVPAAPFSSQPISPRPDSRPVARPPMTPPAPSATTQPSLPLSQQATNTIPVTTPPAPAAFIRPSPQQSLPMIANASTVTGHRKREDSPAISPASASSLSDADYNRLCSAIRSISVRSLLQQQTFPLNLSGDTLLIGVVSEPNLATLKAPNRLIHVEKAAEAFFGRPVKIELIHQKNRPVGSSVQSLPMTGPISTPIAATTAINPGFQTEESRMPSGFSASGDPTAERFSGNPAVKADVPPILKSPALPLPPLDSVNTPQPALRAVVIPQASHSMAPSAETPAKRPPAMEAVRTSAPIDFSSPPPISGTSSAGSQVSMLELESTPPLLGHAFSTPHLMDDALPPMEDDAPPDDYTPLNDSNVSQALKPNQPNISEVQQAQAPSLNSSGSEDAASEAALKEAQQHAVQLLQGKIL
jgi:DNA polymerase-3 subunit gamma/tau